MPTTQTKEQIEAELAEANEKRTLAVAGVVIAALIPVTTATDGTVDYHLAYNGTARALASVLGSSLYDLGTENLEQVLAQTCQSIRDVARQTRAELVAVGLRSK